MEDPALALAVGGRDWYSKAAVRAMRANVGSEIVLLLAGGTTTAAAGLSAPALLTVGLAATTFVLTGMRQVFGWSRLATGRSVALRKLRAAIALYEVTPEHDRTVEAQRELINEVNRIVAEEQSAWFSFRRERSP